MSKKHIGTFQLGRENIDLYVSRSDCGGDFYFCPDNKSLPIINIGLNYDVWEDVLNVLMHESVEFLIERRGCAYKESGYLCGELSAKLFVFNHSDFSEIIYRSACFISEVMQKVKHEYNLIHKCNKKS